MFNFTNMHAVGMALICAERWMDGWMDRHGESSMRLSSCFVQVLDYDGRHRKYVTQLW